LNVPNGLAHFLDLRFLFNPQTFAFCRYGMEAALALYVLRLGLALVLPYLALLSIATGSTYNSQGAISHHLQIVSLVLLAQTAAYFYGLVRRKTNPASETNAARESRLVFWSQQAIVATYVVSALTKLIRTHGLWFFQTPNIAVQIIKTTEQDFHDWLNPASLTSGIAVADWMLQHPLLIGLMVSFGLILEIGTPIALLGRPYALVYGLALLAFHHSVREVMKLTFANNEYLIWIYFVNVPFWVLFTIDALRRRLVAPQPAAGSINPKSPPLRR
ncbi:MAG: hypothetical protein M3Y86_10630, partial [Verrucomicrobiota bacterium]|nr:hypothetical protein [Verrucomicrobiota bacterium]